MYGLPEDVDLSFFRGREIEQVCLGPHQVIVNFTDRVSVNSACTMEVRTEAGSVRSDDPRVLGPALLSLIAGKVADVRWSTDGTVTLAFEDGATVQLEDDASPFESYEIRNGSDLIVV